MLVIYFKGITPQQRFYSIGVQGNNKSNVIQFVLEKEQANIVLDVDNIILKVRNEAKDYIDKIPLPCVEEDGIIYATWEIESKSTQYRNLEVQLQFEREQNDDNNVIWQTQIVGLELNDTINADKEIERLYPSELKRLEDEIERVDDKVDTKVDKVEGMGLSHNDYTDNDKAKVDSLEEELAKKIDKTSIEDNLNSNDPTKVLSANQGRILKLLSTDYVELSGFGGTLTDEQFEILSKPSAVALLENIIYAYEKTQSGFIILRQAFDLDTYSHGDGSYSLMSARNYIRINITSKSWGFVIDTKDYPRTYTKEQVDTLFSSTLRYRGTLSVAEINALDVSTIKIGDFYNVSDGGVLIVGNIEVMAGDNVAWTGNSWDKLTMDLTIYDDKFISAGFFEVQNYDEDTGNITFVYASDLYDMSYSEDTGVLTIEAQ